MRKAKKGEVYIIEAEGTGQVKIGYSNDSERRLKDLQTGNGNCLLLRHAERCEDETARALEALLHIRFEEKRLKGEWFALDWQTIKNAIPDELENYRAVMGEDNAPDPGDLPPVWCIYPRRTENTMQDFLSKGWIGLGFGGLGDLSKLEPTQQAFREAWEKSAPGNSAAQIRAFYPMFYSFVHRARTGDMVIYPTTWADETIHIGRISGPYECRRWQVFGYRDRRPVEWLGHLDRNQFTTEARKQIQVNLAFFQVRGEEFLAELAALLPTLKELGLDA